MNGFVDCLCCVGSPPPWPAAYIGKIKQEANVKLWLYMNATIRTQACTF